MIALIGDAREARLSIRADIPLTSWAYYNLVYDRGKVIGSITHSRASGFDRVWVCWRNGVQLATTESLSEACDFFEQLAIDLPGPDPKNVPQDHTT
jgi:hypothetical protein